MNVTSWRIWVRMFASVLVVSLTYMRIFPWSYANDTAQNSHKIELCCIAKECKVLCLQCYGSLNNNARPDQLCMRWLGELTTTDSQNGNIYVDLSLHDSTKWCLITSNWHSNCKSTFKWSEILKNRQETSTKHVLNQLIGSEFSLVTIGNHNKERVPSQTFRSGKVVGLCFTFCNWIVRKKY